MVLWEHAIERHALIRLEVFRILFKAQGKKPHECTFGNQSRISNIYNVGWYEWMHNDDFGSFPENKEKLGVMLRPCKNESNEMSQCITASSGRVLTRRTVRSLRTSELHPENEKRKRRIFDDIILKKLSDSVAKPTKPVARDHVPYSDSFDPDSVKLPQDNDLVMPYGAVFFFGKTITDQ